MTQFLNYPGIFFSVIFYMINFSYTSYNIFQALGPILSSSWLSRAALALLSHTVTLTICTVACCSFFFSLSLSLSHSDVPSRTKAWINTSRNRRNSASTLLVSSNDTQSYCLHFKLQTPHPITCALTAEQMREIYGNL